MKFKKLLSEAIDNNTKIIITGKSGWGKSEMIQQVAEEKGLELIDFRLSEVLPEDIVGIPKIKDDFYEYVPPKWLYEVITHPEKKYLLFLDEITQGTPEVLNICYKIFDKVTKVGNYELPNVAVVGATNYADESAYLSALPEPLKKRACMLELRHDADQATDYLLNKYHFNKEESTDLASAIRNCISDSNPRSTEKVLNLIQAGVSKELCIAYVGYDRYSGLLSAFNRTQGNQNLSALDLARLDMDQGYTRLGSKNYKVTEASELIYIYGLSDEEARVLNHEWKLPTETPKVKLERDLMTTWAINNSKTLKANDILSLSSMASFNASKYLRKFKISVSTMTEQFESLKFILHMNDEQLLRRLSENRMLPLDVMKLYRLFLPWDLYKAAYRRGDLTQDKVNEFKKELGL